MPILTLPLKVLIETDKFKEFYKKYNDFVDAFNERFDENGLKQDFFDQITSQLSDSLLPDMTDKTGFVLSNDGTNSLWRDVAEIVQENASVMNHNDFGGRNEPDVHDALNITATSDFIPNVFNVQNFIDGIKNKSWTDLHGQAPDGNTPITPSKFLIDSVAKKVYFTTNAVDDQPNNEWIQIADSSLINQLLSEVVGFGTVDPDGSTPLTLSKIHINGTDEKFFFSPQNNNNIPNNTWVELASQANVNTQIINSSDDILDIINSKFDKMYSNRSLSTTIIPHPYEFFKIQNPNFDAIKDGSRFGFQVAMNETADLLVCGSDDKQVYLYEKLEEGWNLKLVLSPTTNAVIFGWGIGMSPCGKYIGIGRDHTFVDIFEYDKNALTFNLLQTLTVPVTPPSGNSSFGIDISFSANGKTLAILDTNWSSDSGITSGESCIFIYDRANSSNGLWTHVNSIIPIPGSASVSQSVSLTHDGNLLAIGRASDTSQNGFGEVRIFSRSGTTWSLYSTITNPSPNTSDRFGISVCFDAIGDTLFVGKDNQIKDNTPFWAVSTASDFDCVYTYKRYIHDKYFARVTTSDNNSTFLSDSIPTGYRGTVIVSSNLVENVNISPTKAKRIKLPSAYSDYSFQIVGNKILVWHKDFPLTKKIEFGVTGISDVIQLEFMNGRGFNVTIPSVDVMVLTNPNDPGVSITKNNTHGAVTIESMVTDIQNLTNRILYGRLSNIETPGAASLNTWNLKSVLTDPSIERNSSFGFGIACNATGEQLLVADSKYGNFEGILYLYHKPKEIINAWVNVEKGSLDK